MTIGRPPGTLGVGSDCADDELTHWTRPADGALLFGQHQPSTTRRSCSRQFPRPASRPQSQADSCIAVGCANRVTAGLKTAERISGLVPHCVLSTCVALRHTRRECAPGPLTPTPMLMRPTSLAHFQKPRGRCGYPVSVDAHGSGIPGLQSTCAFTPAAWPIPMEPLRALTPKATE